MAKFYPMWKYDVKLLLLLISHRCRKNLSHFFRLFTLMDIPSPPFSCDLFTITSRRPRHWLAYTQYNSRESHEFISRIIEPPSYISINYFIHYWLPVAIAKVKLCQVELCIYLGLMVRERKTTLKKKSVINHRDLLILLTSWNICGNCDVGVTLQIISIF